MNERPDGDILAESEPRTGPGIFQNSLVNVLGLVGITSMGALTGLLTARTLGPEAVGMLAVAEGRVYVTDRILGEGAKNPDSGFSKPNLPGQERVLCLDEMTGEIVWKSTPARSADVLSSRISPGRSAVGGIWALRTESLLRSFGAS